MRRLIKKSQSAEKYVPVRELDEADIKLDRCPTCKTNKNLQKIDGFKICQSCHTKYKMFDGNAYIVIS